MNKNHIPCPKCNNKRLFDASSSTNGEIEIKCPTCRSVVSLDITNGYVTNWHVKHENAYLATIGKEKVIVQHATRKYSYI